MFKITVNGHSYHESANGRTPEEFQHHLTTVEGMKFVHVAEWVSGGARSPLLQRDEAEDE